MNRTHASIIPGLDHELCPTCGYVPTQHQIDSLNELIERERQKDKPRVKIIEQIQQQVKMDSQKMREHQENSGNVQPLEFSPD